MSSEAARRIQIAISGGGKDKAKPNAKRANAVRRIMDREQSRERRVRESSVASNTRTPAVRKPSGPACANKACRNPRVVDGTCQTCGSVADDSNIVAEITFGETSSGAAVVQGSYLAADQGGVRGVGGLAFRRVAGGGASEARERSLREAKALLNQFVTQLRLPQSLADTAYRFYRVASNNNFVQGRRKTNVAAICLYAACRKDYTNKTMLIDLADLIKTDVFLLGRGYKEFLNQFPDMREGTKPIIMEDLIFRFASKLELLHDTNKVAESAVRIAQRMRFDNMTHGRRPAGICGAAVIMAARAHNYRRTVREVVFIAKVTMATLQERMEEFANVPSAQMTISDFHKKEYSGPAYDPPTIYKNTQEWKEKHARPRKRKAPTANGYDGNQDEDSQQNRDKRPRAEPNTQQHPLPTPGPSASPAPPPQANPPVIDKDGFVVPPLPQHVIDPALTAAQESTPPEELPMDNATVLALTGENEEVQLDVFASHLGRSNRQEQGDDDEEDDDDLQGLDPSSELAMAVAQGIVEAPVAAMAQKAGKKGTKTGGRKKMLELPVDEEWEMDEANLEEEMEAHLADPELVKASEGVAQAVEARRARETAAAAEASGQTVEMVDANDAAVNEPAQEPVVSPYSLTSPPSKVSMDPIVHEDEFKDDPEVQNCLLPDREVKIKERVWANHNKDYLRKKQQKLFNDKLAETAPKKRRNRTRKPRIGEGASPAASAGEATANMAQTRGMTTKLIYPNVDHISALFSAHRGPGSVSAGTTPRALGSELGSELGSDNEDENDGNDRRLRSPTPPAGQTATPAPSNVQPSSTGPAQEEEEEGGDEDDYHNDTEIYDGQNGYEDETFAEDDYDPFADNGNEDEDGYDGMDED